MGFIRALRNFMTTNNEPDFDTSSKSRYRAWVPSSSGPNSVIYSISEMRNKSRDLTRKFPNLTGAYDTVSSNIVSTGINVLPKSPDKKFKNQIKKLWEQWTEECDSEEINDFGALLDLAVRERWEVGEVFIRHRPRRVEDGYVVPYQIQILESEFVPLDMTNTLPNGGCIIAGIEFDARGRRVAYHMYRSHPGDSLLVRENYETVRVPASEVCHYFKPIRAGQVRGIPECFAALVKSRDLLIYDEAELIRKQMSSLLAGFITSPLDAADVINADDSDFDVGPGEAMTRLTPGMMMALEPGEDIKFSNPAESGGSYEPFLKHVLRSIAVSLNLTYEEFTGDLSGVNFSSIRVGLNQVQRKYRKEQKRLMHMIMRPIWKHFVEAAVLSGAIEVDLKKYNEDPHYFSAVKFQPPGWAYVNPVQEVNALREQVKAGFKSRAQVVAEIGEDIEEIDEQIDIDAERAAKLGLVFEVDPTKGKGAPPPQLNCDPDKCALNQ